MKKFERLFRIYLSVTFTVYSLLAFGVSSLLILKGYFLLFIFYFFLLILSLLLLRPWDKKRFFWYIEEGNPHLKERLISLYELLEKGVRHPSVDRLIEEVSSEKVTYRPKLRLVAIPFLLSMLFLLLSFVHPSQKPPSIFQPNSISILAGDSLKVSGTFRGDTLVVLLGSDTGSADFTLLVGKRQVKGTISNLEPGEYTLRVKGRSGKGKLKVLSRPVLYSVEGYIVPPAYTGLSKRPIQRENVAYENSTFDSLKIEHSGDSAKFSNLPEVLKRDTTVFVEVFKKGKAFKYPAFSVKVLKDKPPSVIFQPIGIVKAEGDVPAVVSAYDDIALKEIGMEIFRNGKWERERLGPYSPVPNATYDLTFNPQDSLKIVAYAVDVAGQVSFSDTLILLPKTPEEILRERLLSQKGEEVREIERRLKELQEEVEVSQSLDESTKEEISRVMGETERVYKDIKKALERVASQIRDPELARLMLQVQRLLQENMDKELAEALKRLEEAMKRVKPEEIAQALKNLHLTQKELRENLERFKKLLERYAQEKRLRDLAQKLQDLAAEQAEIEGKKELYKQGEIRSQVEDALKTLDSLKDVEDIEKEKLSKLESELRASEERMSAAMDKMRSGGDFQSEQREARRSLEKAADLAQSLYRNLVQKRVQEVVHKLNEISDAATFTDMRLDRNLSENTLEAARAVALDMEAKLKELSQKSAFVSPSLSKMARKTYDALDEALQKMKGKDAEGAKRDIKEAQSLLRALALSTQSSAQACKNSDGSTGLQAYMRKLAEMAAEQRGISHQLGSGMSSQQLAEMLARQMALRKALEGLIEGLKEGGAPSDALNQLEKALKEMEVMEKEMGRPDALERRGELRKLSQRISIRLLEARKALRRQRTEPKYEAQRPKPYKVERAYVRPIIDRSKILEIYREYSRSGKLSPQEKEMYENYIKRLLQLSPPSP